MGCFPILRSKKKQTEEIIRATVSFKEVTPSKVPEQKTHSGSFSSPPRYYRTRSNNNRPTNRVNGNRIRALSDPCSIHVCFGDPKSMEDFKEEEECKDDHWLPKPQALPLPSPQSASSFKNLSFKSSSGGATTFSGPLPLPPLVNLRNFSFKEIAAACKHFSSGSCITEGLSSTVYKASFGDDTPGKKFEATITRLFLLIRGTEIL